MVELEEDASFEYFANSIHVAWCFLELLETISIEPDKSFLFKLKMSQAKAFF